MPSIKLNDKEYEIKRKLSFGEVRRFQKSMSNISDISNKLKNASAEELETIAIESTKNTTEEMELIEETLKSCFGFTQEQLNTLTFPDAILLFNEIFTKSTEVKKKSDQPYV